MYLSVAKENLSHLLYLSNSIVERKNTMPVLANVKLTADKDRLTISATDLEVSLTGETEATVKTPGSITVDARVLYEIARDLPNESITLHVTKGQRLEIESGQSRFKINGISSDEFPSLAGVVLNDPIPVEAFRIAEMLDKTAYAVSTDETRYNINGVSIETVNNGGGPTLVRFVATDGHRLAFIERPADGLVIEKPVILPRKGIQELKKVLEDNDGAANIGVHEGFFTVQSKNVTIGIRLVDGQFPDYRQVIPVDRKTKVELGREELISAVKRVSLVTTDKNKAVKFKLVGGNLLVSSQSPEYGEASENISVDQEGDDVTIGFSARYIIELLSTMSNSEKITINLNGEVGPGVFQSAEDEQYTCIVMPMRFE